MLLKFSKSLKLKSMSGFLFRNLTMSTHCINKCVNSSKYYTHCDRQRKMVWAMNGAFWMNILLMREYSNPLPPLNNQDEALVDVNTYEIVCNETLELLCDYFEELVESSNVLKDADVVYGDGVLTINFGIENGTYVINRQSPNRQIWLSSPTSGPKRYDFIPTNSKTGEKCEGYWLYRHENRTLHELLQEEIPKIIKSKTNFCKLKFGKK